MKNKSQGRKMDFKIPKAIKKAMQIMKENGFESYIVGGSVRDFLMGIPPHDFDITTDALPEETKECFKKYKVIETGIKHGTVTVLIDREPIEITTFRIDGEYKDNRHPESVEFTPNLADDLSRRDFTVNALAYDGEEKIVDLFSGKEDLKNKIIRCVGNPDKRFNEDGLRILRALRFSAVLGFSIEDETEKSIRKNKMLLENISKERILAELTKLVCGKNAKSVLGSYREVFEVIIPEIKGFKEYEKSLETLEKVEASKELKFSCLFSECEDAGGVLKDLKCDNHTLREVRELTDDLKLEIKADEIFIKKLLKTREFSMLLKVMDLKSAFGEDENKCAEIKKIILKTEKMGDCVKLSQLEIKGKDILELELAEGKKVGILLEYLLDSVIEGHVENEKNKLIEYAKKSQ